MAPKQEQRQEPERRLVPPILPKKVEKDVDVDIEYIETRGLERAEEYGIRDLSPEPEKVEKILDKIFQETGFKISLDPDAHTRWKMATTNKGNNTPIEFIANINGHAVKVFFPKVFSPITARRGGIMEGKKSTASVKAHAFLGGNLGFQDNLRLSTVATELLVEKVKKVIDILETSRQHWKETKDFPEQKEVDATLKDLGIDIP